jgi:ankyrin
VAVERNHVDRVQQWITAGKNVDGQGESGDTPLHVAVTTSNLPMVKTLAAAKANINLKNRAGRAPVQVAVANDHLEIAQHLVKNGCTIPDLLTASLGGNIPSLESFVKNDPKAIRARTKQKSTALHLAAWAGHRETVGFLLQHGADPNETAEQRWTALHVAAANGHEGVVLELLEKKADVNCKVQYSNFQPLHLAYLAGNIAVARILIDHKADVNAKAGDPEAITLVQRAARDGKTDFLRLLLAAGASVSEFDSSARTSLHWAAKRGDLSAAEILIKHKADVNAKKRAGVYTPLHQAATKEMAELLIRHKADVNAGIEEKTATPLHWAVEDQNKDVVEVLLKHRADVTAKNGARETPLEIARRIGAKEIVELLRRYGAKE